MLINRYYRLWLYLFFCINWLACAAGHKTGYTVISTQHQVQKSYWVLKARLLSGFGGFAPPLVGVDAFQVESNNITEAFNVNYNKTILIQYRFNSREQCEQAIGQLMDTGMVNFISTNKESN
jgi:hypothetical protein